MQALEFETRIDKKGRIFLPEEFQHAYGKSARLLVLLPEQAEMPQNGDSPAAQKES
jgi:DNA-binding transcriptional regulator/RsmH inhibitor MraZ